MAGSERFFAPQHYEQEILEAGDSPAAAWQDNYEVGLEAVLGLPQPPEETPPDEEPDGQPATQEEASAGPVADNTVVLFGFKGFTNDIGKVPLLTQQDEIDLAKRIERGDKVSRRHMVEANLRLVVSIAKLSKYKDRGFDLSDLVQEGALGLIGAVDEFDYRRRNRFSTMAVPRIHTAIKEAIRDRGRSVRLPGNIVASDSNIRRATDILQGELRREPTRQEIAKWLRTDSAHVEATISASRAVRSLDEPVTSDSEDSDMSLSDTLTADRSGQAVPKAVIQKDGNQALYHSLRRLSPEKQKILVLHDGLDGGEPMAFNKIVPTLNLPSLWQARKLYNQALAELENTKGLREKVTDEAID